MSLVTSLVGCSCEPDDAGAGTYDWTIMAVWEREFGLLSVIANDLTGEVMERPVLRLHLMPRDWVGPPASSGDQRPTAQRDVESLKERIGLRRRKE